MNIRVQTEDGREISSTGKHRYHVLRLTHDGGFKARGTDNAREGVVFARTAHNRFGFHYIVVDTVTCRTIASYPDDEDNPVRVSLE